MSERLYLIDFLIGEGINVNVIDEFGMTALMYSAWLLPDIRIISILLRLSDNLYFENQYGQSFLSLINSNDTLSAHEKNEIRNLFNIYAN